MIRRYVLLSIVLVLILASFSQVISFNEEAVDEVEALDFPTRAQQFYLDGTFPLAPSWNEEQMLIVAYLQNRDDYEETGESLSGAESGDFDARQVANSLTVFMDGTTYSSGSDKRVLIELFTATNCYYCPPAEGVTNDMIEDESTFPGKVSVIQYHINGDQTLVETVSTAASSKYKATGTPTGVFDGERFLVGSSSSPAANDPNVWAWYRSTMNDKLTYDPLVTIRGSGSNNDTEGHFNISVEVTGALPRGNWTLKAVVCEDMTPRMHGEAPIRFVARTSRSVFIPQLGEGVPHVVFNEDRTYENMKKEHRGNLTVHWSAWDEQDGTELEIDIMAKTPTTGWEYIAQDLENTGSYRWNTYDPRVPDAKGYRLQVIARDSDGKESSDIGIETFDLNNPDLPEFDLLYPDAGTEVSGGFYIEWDARDDEDDHLDLLVSCSISPDDGSNWEVLSRDPVTGDPFAFNQNQLWFNSGKIDLMTGEPRYPDSTGYRLRFVVKDKDNMMIEHISEPFSIYNNDMPTGAILSPQDGDVISDTLDIGFSLTDQEDAANDLFSSFSLSRNGGAYVEIYNGTFDEPTGNLTFSTEDVGGDGDYMLRFIVTDSRGLASDPAFTAFTIYDPDPPMLFNLSGPNGEVKGLSTFTWESSDPDAEETATYRISIRPLSGDWEVLAEDITEASYRLDTTGFPDGDYEVMVKAWDTSALRLTDEMMFPSFTINNPDPPSVSLISPKAQETLNTTVLIQYTGNDQDDDTLTYNIYYHRRNVAVWTLIVEGKTNNQHMWNFSELEEGEYYIKVEATDSSEEALTHSAEVGPVFLKIYVPQEKDDPKEQPTTGGGDEEKKDNNDLLLISLVVAGALGLIIILAILLVMMLSRSRKKRMERDAVPENDGDLIIPDIESIEINDGVNEMPQQPVYQGQVPQGGQEVQQQIMDPRTQQVEPQYPAQMAPASQQAPAAPETYEGQMTQGDQAAPGQPVQNDRFNPGQ